jgi:hypothetical protein
VKTLISFALGALLSLGTVTSASAAGTNVAAPAQVPDAGIEVIVVVGKRPAAQPIDAAQPIEVFVVTAKRATQAEHQPPPATTIAIPKLELAVEERPVFRL